MIRKAEFSPFVRNEYPTSDGRPMAETDFHRDLMVRVIDVLQTWFAYDPFIYVSGNLLVCYEEGNKRRHVAPDAFVVKGVPSGKRENYLIWKEGRSPDVVIEITSRTTRDEDTQKKFELYRDRLRVKEYFLFDPFEEYLFPSLLGYRRVKDQFRTIRPIDGRIPSRVLGLHLERDDDILQLWNPDSRVWLKPASERANEATRTAELAELARREAELELRESIILRKEADLARRIAEAETARLQSENEILRQQLNQK